MTIRLGLALGLAAVLASANARAEADAPAAHVIRISGEVEATAPGTPVWRPAHAGLAIAAGGALRTGDRGRAEVALANGTVRVYENTLLRVPGSDAKTERVRLLKGAGLFDVKLSQGRAFRVETPEAVAAVKGTRFLVETARSGFFTGVYEGVVELRQLVADTTAPVLVRDGFGAALRDDVFELAVLDRPDPWRDWERGVSPRATAPGPAAPDRGGEEPKHAQEAAGEAAIEAVDSALEVDREGSAAERERRPGADGGKGGDAWPAKQDDLSVEDAVDPVDKLEGGTDSPVIDVERPDRPEPPADRTDPTPDDNSTSSPHNPTPGKAH
jgi:hypothetical protein